MTGYESKRAAAQDKLVVTDIDGHVVRDARKPKKAQPAQEHVGFVDSKRNPIQRPWVGLTEEDFSAINQSCFTKLQAATSAESILKEKNNGT